MKALDEEFKNIAGKALYSLLARELLLFLGTQITENYKNRKKTLITESCT